jgi:hypothetical protein
MINGIDPIKFNEVFGAAKPAHRTRIETREHYEGELEKLHQQHLEALFDTRKRRPELPLDSIVGLVNWNLDCSISTDVIDQFKKEIGNG